MADPNDTPGQVAEEIFASAQHYAAAASHLVLTNIRNVSIITTLPSTRVEPPEFDAPPFGAELINIPPFVAPDINIRSFPRPDFSQVWTYSSDFLTTLRAWMNAEITMGNIGLTEQSQNDLFDAGAERDLQTLSEEKNKVSAKWAKSNWGKPDGVLLASMAHADKAYTDKRYEVSKSIRLECEKIAIERLREALQKAIVLEQSLISYAPEMAKAMAQAYGAEASAYKTEIDAQISLLSAFIKNYNAILKGRAAAVKSGALIDGMNIDYADAVFTGDAANAEIAVKLMELELNYALSSHHLSNTRNVGIAQVGAQLFAGAVSSCHMQAHLGDSYSVESRTSSTVTVNSATRTSDVTNNITNNQVSP